MRRDVRQRVRAQEEAQLEADLAELEALYPHAVVTESGWSYVVIRPGTGSAMNPGDTAMVHYTGRTLRGMAFASSPGSGRPRFFLPGENAGGIFPLVVGESTVNAGLDEAVFAMKPGERRLVIVPASLGYDPVGFYGRERPNEPRFVIHPRSILIYEVAVVGTELSPIHGAPNVDGPISLHQEAERKLLCSTYWCIWPVRSIATGEMTSFADRGRGPSRGVPVSGYGPRGKR